MKKNITKKLKQIPTLPGVYIYKDSKNNIIYIGKALNLLNRVRSYFSRNNDIKTRVLVKKIDDIECFVTSNEVEALLLENNLIKKYQPKYNIQLKDAKSYPMLKITNENLPRIIKCREKISEKDEYYGPYISVTAVNYLQKIFIKILKIRSCNKKFYKPYNYKPCLYYFIDNCCAPCASHINEKEYLKLIDMARDILQGKTQAIIDILKEKMVNFSKNLEFEQAASIRDQIKVLEEFNLLQYIDTQSKENLDYIGIYSDFKTASISLIQERNGKIIGKENFIITNFIDYSSICPDFLNAYYLNITNFPSTVIIQEEFENKKLLINALKKKFNVNIEIRLPENSKERKLIILSKENAEIYFEEKHYKLEKINELRELKKAINLPKIPRIIEGIDIATLDGKYNTGALVNFTDGKPNKTEYRQFNIAGAGYPDDYSMIEELVARRYQRLKNENKTLPDLILVDGGKGQVNAVKKSLSLLGLELKVIGLAKKDEHIHIDNINEPLILSKDSQALKLLQKIRDEAHRFSNVRLNKRYSKKNLTTKLLTIDGLGQKKINSIFQKYGSLKSFSEATIEDIANIEGIGLNLAKKIYAFLH